MVLRGPDADRGLRRLESVLRSCGAQAQLRLQGPDRRFALTSPDAGPVLLEVAFNDSPTGYVGLQFVVSGELLGMPSFVEIAPEEVYLAERTRSFVRCGLEAACRELAVLYGGVDFEWRIPAPAELLSERGRLPADLYWSHVLDDRDSGLATSLSDIYGIPGVLFDGGTLLPGGGVLEPGLPHISEPITAGRAAALRLHAAFGADHDS